MTHFVGGVLHGIPLTEELLQRVHVMVDIPVTTDTERGPLFFCFPQHYYKAMRYSGNVATVFFAFSELLKQDPREVDRICREVLP